MVTVVQNVLLEPSSVPFAITRVDSEKIKNIDVGNGFAKVLVSTDDNTILGAQWFKIVFGAFLA